MLLWRRQQQHINHSMHWRSGQTDMHRYHGMWRPHSSAGRTWCSSLSCSLQLVSGCMMTSTCASLLMETVVGCRRRQTASALQVSIVAFYSVSADFMYNHMDTVCAALLFGIGRIVSLVSAHEAIVTALKSSKCCNAMHHNVVCIRCFLQDSGIQGDRSSEQCVLETTSSGQR